MDCKYIENLNGSPYIKEAEIAPLQKIKNTIKNFLKPKDLTVKNEKLNLQQNDFVEIVLTVTNFIINKISTDLKTNHKKSDTSITESETEEKGSKQITKLHVSNSEDKIGWLSWFRGQYRKSRKFGLDFTKETEIQTIKLSNGKSKQISIKWSNNVHENKIIVAYKNVNPIAVTEEIKNTENLGEFILFKFYDDQVNPKSPSFNPNENLITLFLEQANPYSNLIDKIKNDSRLIAKTKELTNSFYNVIEQKWTEFKGHPKNPIDIKFTLNSDKSISYDSVSLGTIEKMPLNVINSILEKGEVSNTDDSNLKDTGLDFEDFVDTLKNSGLKSDELLSDAAREGFNNKTNDSIEQPILSKSNQANKPIDKNKTKTSLSVAQKYNVEDGYILGPDPKFLDNSKKPIKSWNIENTNDIPSEVLKIVHNTPELKAKLKSEIERLNALKLNKSTIQKGVDLSASEIDSGFSPFPMDKKLKENIKNCYKLKNIFN